MAKENQGIMKIIWHGVPSDYGTGYGVQTKLFTRALKAAGFDVIISSVIPGVCRKNDDGIMTFSCGPRPCYGNDFIDSHHDRLRPDLWLSSTDTFVYDCEKFRKLPWIAWQIIDTNPMGPYLFKPCAAAKFNMAMSHDAKACLDKAGFTNNAYVPLAYSKADFFPVARDEARKWIKDLYGVNWGDNFVVMMNSANMSKPSRKNFAAAFEGFARFKKQDKSAIMYCHTEHTGQIYNGEDLRELCKLFGLTDKDVFFPNQWEYNMQILDAQYMRMCYNALSL